MFPYRVSAPEIRSGLANNDPYLSSKKLAEWPHFAHSRSNIEEPPLPSKPLWYSKINDVVVQLVGLHNCCD